jgi:hypothetical protein
MELLSSSAIHMEAPFGASSSCADVEKWGKNAPNQQMGKNLPKSGKVATEQKIAHLFNLF